MFVTSVVFTPLDIYLILDFRFLIRCLSSRALSMVKVNSQSKLNAQTVR